MRFSTFTQEKENLCFEHVVDTAQAPSYKAAWFVSASLCQPPLISISVSATLRHSCKIQKEYKKQARLPLLIAFESAQFPSSIYMELGYYRNWLYLR